MIWLRSKGWIILFGIMACQYPERTIKPNINNEFPTTVILRLTNQSDPSDVQMGTWEQLLDANGVQLEPDVSKAGLILKKNSIYLSEITVLDKTKNPVDDLTEEVKSRSNLHLFFYQPLQTTGDQIIPFSPPDVYPAPIPTPLPAMPVLNLTVHITDYDTNNPPLPLGIESQMATGGISSGWLRVVLRHQPISKDGTFAPGSSDVDVGFSILIQ
jgi:hypothetical protein